jgi:hypothetical protein
VGVLRACWVENIAGIEVRCWIWIAIAPLSQTTCGG